MEILQVAREVGLLGWEGGGHHFVGSRWISIFVVGHISLRGGSVGFCTRNNRFKILYQKFEFLRLEVHENLKSMIST